MRAEIKTYSESKDRANFDWNDFLERAINGTISMGDQEYAECLANNWITCACGNLCKSIPRYKNGEPKDFILNILGSKFYTAISHKNYDEAKEILKRIEERSIELLAAAA